MGNDLLRDYSFPNYIYISFLTQNLTTDRFSHVITVKKTFHWQCIPMFILLDAKKLVSFCSEEW